MNKIVKQRQSYRAWVHVKDHALESIAQNKFIVGIANRMIKLEEKSTRKDDNAKTSN